MRGVLPVYARAAVVVTAAEGRVIGWNAGAERLYGWRSREAKGRNALDLIPMVQQRDRAAEVMALLQAGVSWSGETIARRHNGLPIACYWMAFPLGDLARGAGVVVAVSVPLRLAGKIARHRVRLETALHRAAYGRSLIRRSAPTALAAQGFVRGDPRLGGGYQPIGPVHRLQTIHALQAPSKERWALMQRIEVYRYRAERLRGDGRLHASGRSRLADMWLRLAQRLNERGL